MHENERRPSASLSLLFAPPIQMVVVAAALTAMEKMPTSAEDELLAYHRNTIDTCNVHYCIYSYAMACNRIIHKNQNEEHKVSAANQFINKFINTRNIVVYNTTNSRPYSQSQRDKFIIHGAAFVRSTVLINISYSKYNKYTANIIIMDILLYHH